MTTQILPPSTQQYESMTWEWRGHAIQYTAQGAGQPLLLIHGFGASIGHWNKNIAPLAAQGYRVYALDLLGFGNSAKPPIAYSMELWQEQLRDFWREKIQQPAVLIGNSIGGLITLAMMADEPEMVAAGVVLNCAGGLNHRPDELNLPMRVLMGTFRRVVTSAWVGPILFHSIRQKHQIRRTLYQVYGDRLAVTEELVEMLYRPSCDPGAQKVFASIIGAPSGPKPVELMARIEQPLLILWGEKDPWAPIADAGIYQARAQLRDDTEFRAIAGAGHCPHDEAPDRVNALILDWLKKVA